MDVKLRYGRAGLKVNLPETPGFKGVIQGAEAPAQPNPTLAIVESLDKPIQSKSLAEIARGRRSACIVISDITRPAPTPLMLPPILEVLAAAGVPREAITILVATGTHRVSTHEERVMMVGEDIARTYTIIDHEAERDDEMIEIARIYGDVPALINRLYFESDLKILTGFIEPHPWAGYSGGRKSILPGISSMKTLEHMHGPELVAHPKCKYGVLEGNPFHAAGLEVMAAAGADFIVNVTLDSHHRITGVFSGHPVEAHLAGCAFAASQCTCEVDGPLDFVLTTNGGAPLDVNLYQTTKGIAAAVPVLAEKGDILIVSECKEGVGTPAYQKVLDMIDTPQAFVERVMSKQRFMPEQWCAQEMCQIAMRHDIHLYTEGLPPDDIRRYALRPVTDVMSGLDALLEKHGRNARWAVIPEGPLVILRPGMTA